MLPIKNLLTAFILVLLSQSAWAFMPAPGIWGVDSENNGLPGRGFQIEAENEIIVFTYFGYRPDGTSVFYYAAGPITNNTFTASLLDLHSGTTFGGQYKAAALHPPIGNVTITFTSGIQGTITFPGEGPRPISKRPFGYANGPDGLLGTWLITGLFGTTSALSDVRNLDTKTGETSIYGNGIVTTANSNFACEYITADSFAGNVLCLDIPSVTYSDVYIFQFNGDNGTGATAWYMSNGNLSSPQNSHAIRIKTKTGKSTGINDGVNYYVDILQSTTLSDSKDARDDRKDLKEQMTGVIDHSAEDEEKIKFMESWSFEVNSILKNRN